jgi:GNAT superfamily N-acetyltransferase
MAAVEPRLAHTGDAPEVVRLAALMYTSMGLDATGLDWRENAMKVMAERLGGDEVAVFVIDDPENAGALAACGGVAVIQRLPGPNTRDGRWGYVQWISTEPRHQRRGFARAIMTAILAWCEARGIQNVELHATAQGEPLYRSMGFTDPHAPELRRQPKK